MEKIYQHAGIAGKFRLMHIAHRELILHAISQTEFLHIFIVDLPEQRRYSTIDGLMESFESIFRKLGFTEYAFHIIREDLSGDAWDRKVLSLVPQLDVMFDSKEVYGNSLVNNKFIELTISKDVSASSIEKNPYAMYESNLVAPEFWPNMRKHIQIMGDEQGGKTLLAKKLALLFGGKYIDGKMEAKEYRRIEKKIVFYDDITHLDFLENRQLDGVVYIGKSDGIDFGIDVKVVDISNTNHLNQFYEAIAFINNDILGIK